MIGLIGAGAMGSAMAEHLLRAGQTLQIFVRRPEALNEHPTLETLGAQLTLELTELASCEVIISNVTGTDDVLSVVNALAPQLNPGSLWLDHSTIAPEGARQAATRLSEAGVDFVDAPVSGGVAGAKAGNLVAMVGGDAERAAPVFAPYIANYTAMGPVGAGQVAKLCNQIAQVVNIQGIAEAMNFAASQGVDLGQTLKAIQGGMAGSRMLDLMGPKMATSDFSAGIENRLHAKDLGIARETLGTQPSPALDVALAQLNKLQDAGHGTLDTSALLTLLRGQD